jgi:hypothetical protein
MYSSNQNFMSLSLVPCIMIRLFTQWTRLLDNMLSSLATYDYSALSIGNIESERLFALCYGPTCRIGDRDAKW